MEIELNPSQKEAVLAFDVPLLISAGAGSGKTRVITYKIAHIIQNLNTPPFRILALTFTNKAADEMIKRIHSLHDLPRTGLWLGTFHSLCSRILKIEMEEPFIIIDENDKKSIVKDIIHELDLDKDVYDPYQTAAIISKLKNHGITFSHHEKSMVPDELSQIFAVYKKYEEYKKKAQYLDFDDLLIQALSFLSRNKDVLEKYKDKFRYILVDEFQDTNDLQYELTRLLGQGSSHVTIVGDPDQSIYSWRGADVQNFKKFLADFKDCRIIKLEQNYRSPNIILKAATCVISKNSTYDNKKLWSQKGEGQKLKYFSGHYIEDESRFVMERIKELAEKGCPHRDIAVFCRTNYYYENLEFAFREANIPYRIIGGMKFFDRLEIKNILAYLRLLNNFNDDISLLRILNIPSRGIGNKSMEKLKALARRENKSLFTVLDRMDQYELIEGKKNEIKKFLKTIRDLALQQEKMKVDEFLEMLLDRIDYRKYMEKFPEFELRYNNIMDLVDDAKNFRIKYPDATVRDYVDRISLISEIDTLDENENKVNIITIHNAKGLEFPVVFMIGLFDGMFPHYKVLNSDFASRDLEEERRLFYVGLTRAQDLIFLTTCQTQRTYLSRRMRITKPSQFLLEIPSQYIEYVTE